MWLKKISIENSTDNFRPSPNFLAKALRALAQLLPPWCFVSKGRYWVSKGRRKKQLIFKFRSKGGGVSADPRNPYQKIIKRGLSEKLSFFGIIFQKMGWFIKRTGIFLAFFAEKGGGVWAK